jgi:NDP-sugar pyrophosphorylase family protein
MRLRPLTQDVPKPMLQVGDRPLLELIVDQLRAAGIRRVNMATHYKGEIIAQHFGNGHGFGVEIVYVTEDQPLGTAGALTLVEASDDPILVINGDILTRLDVRSMLEFHREHDADMTVAVKLHEFQLPYGVVEIKGSDIVGISEKPKIQHFINAGVYLLRSSLCKAIPTNQSYDMPDLIQQVLRDGGRVVSFPVHEYWLDIGQVDDYAKAKNDHALGR